MSEQKLVQKKNNCNTLSGAEDDEQWFLVNETALKEQYLYKYIAIKNHQVILSADTPEEMIEKAKKAGIYLNQVLCSYIQKGKGPSPINI